MREQPCCICGEKRVLCHVNKKFYCKDHQREARAAALSEKEQWKSETEPSPEFPRVDRQTIRSVV